MEEVEPASEIVKRFNTGAMSHGSISGEAHETLAIAMNRLGGNSNTGEGGEDPARYKPLPNGDSLNCGIKQVASGRFGVTIEYLANARILQIKMAQGAKPGEGGQLPGYKVTDEIARLRHSTPGVSLISPPPHHDIYSIEDLAQLIYDLKCANPGGMVSVKLVSEVGVGTVAAGVAKGYADEVLISGHDGGTGASPLSSIKHAGTPWEIGLAETQQTLVLNGLRDRILVQCDGQMRTGRDVVIGALLGAERFGFGTSALVSLGCILMRKCHLGTCPVGIATQDPDLRKRFHGKAEYVVRFLTFVAEDIRRDHGRIGLPQVRRHDRPRRAAQLQQGHRPLEGQGAGLLGRLRQAGPVQRLPAAPRAAAERHAQGPPRLDRSSSSSARPSSEGTPTQLEMPIRNVHRTVGAILSNRIVKLHGGKGLPDGTFDLTFTGSAGQSFGAFLAKGVTLKLIGDANDYLGKGLSGGRIIVQTPPGSPFDPKENVIVGNTLLYGATSGEVFINGLTGERFAVRNSGAIAVVEGVGDHGCEYMTGGIVVVLGPHGPQLRRRHERRHRLRARRAPVVRHALQPRHGRPRTGPPRRGPRLAARPHPPPLPLDRQPAGEDDPRPLAGDVGPVRQGHADRLPQGPAPPPRTRAGQERGCRCHRRGVPLVNTTLWIGPIGPIRRIKSATKLYATPKSHRWPIPPVSSNSRARKFPTVRFRSGSRTGTKSTSRWSTSVLNEQAARCMDCGIPFCHGVGCPVKNRIPEFNDLVYRGHWQAAAENLHSTNNFPEITGRVCPAPCEAACTLAINDRAGEHQAHRVSDRRTGLPRRLGRAHPARHADGQAGGGHRLRPVRLAAAQQINRAGHETVVFEKDDRIGGLLRYGIPDFKLEKRIIDRRLEQMSREGVRFQSGVEVGRDITAAELRSQFDAVCLCMGAGQARPLSVTGADLRGVHLAMDFLSQQNRRVAGDDPVPDRPRGPCSPPKAST